MMTRKGDKICIEGPITINNVVAMTRQGISFFEGQMLAIDLANVTEVDSSIVSMLLEWLREANKNGHHLHYINMPENLKSLLQLYDVLEFFHID